MNYGLVYFIIYLFVVAWLSWYGMKKTKDLRSFAIGSGDVGAIATALTFAATFVSAGTFLGLTGQAYAIGMSVIWFPMGQWLPAMLGLALMAAGYRLVSDKMKSLTLGDWLGDRYNSHFLRVFVALVTLLNIMYVGAQFVGVGIIMEQIMGVPYNVGVVIGIGIVVAYIFIGGTYAHVYTNVFQGAMMAVVAVAVVVFGAMKFPDIMHSLPAALAAQDPKLVGYLNPSFPAYATPVAIIGIFVAHLFWGINPHLINKVQYLKGKGEIRKFILWTGFFMFIMGIVTFGGLYARVLVPGLPKPDAAIPALIGMLFPKAIGGLFLVTLIAATMSTTDGLMVYLATVFGNTLYKETWIKYREFKGHVVDKQHVEKVAYEISKWGTIVIGILALPVAWSQPKFLITLLWVGSCGVLSTVAGPILVGVWSKKAHKKAAWVAAVGGLAGYLYLYMGGITKSVYLAGAQGCTISVALMLIATYMLKPYPDEDYSGYFPEKVKQA